MADDKKKTADEILDNMAEEMGVDKDEKASSKGGGMEGLDDIFGVSSKKKKKKAEPVAAAAAKKDEDSADEEEEDAQAAAAAAEDDEPEEVVEPKKEAPKAAKAEPKKEAKKEEPKVAKTPEAKPKKSGAGIDGIFSPHDDSDDVDLSASKKRKAEPHLDEDDLGDYEPKKGANTTIIAVAVVVVVVLGAIVAVVGPNTLKLVLTGEYREHKMAEKKRIEDEFNRKQLEGLERYGMLTITGNPLYAQIKLNGEIPYAPTSTGAYRQLTLQPGVSNFQDLKVKQKHLIEISAPGYEPKTIELTEGMWKGDRENPTATFSYDISANLTPTSLEAKQEFDARMASDAENEFFGTITLNSQPAGAKVIFNNEVLVNEKGEELKTPVTFDKAWVKDEKTGKLKEAPVRVDTPMDLGHKIEVMLPDQPDMPKFVMQLNRQLWTCTKLPEADLKKLPKEHPPTMECAYSYQKTFDFTGVKAYIQRLEEERKRVEAENQKRREELEKLKNAAESKGVEQLTSK